MSTRKTSAQYKATQRAKMRAAGLKKFEVWATPKQIAFLKTQLNQLKTKEEPK